MSFALLSFALLSGYRHPGRPGSRRKIMNRCNSVFVPPPPPPPPPNTIKTANEGRFRLNVDSPYGERAQSTVLTRAPPRRPARPHRDFIFNLRLSMRESKASPVVVCSPCRRKKALSTRCQLICWPLLPTFMGGLVTQPNKGRTSPWQMPAGQAGAANISWSASAGRR